MKRYLLALLAAATVASAGEVVFRKDYGALDLNEEQAVWTNNVKHPVYIVGGTFFSTPTITGSVQVLLLKSIGAASYTTGLLYSAQSAGDVGKVFGDYSYLLPSGSVVAVRATTVANGQDLGAQGHLFFRIQPNTP